RGVRRSADSAQAKRRLRAAAKTGRLLDSPARAGAWGCPPKRSFTPFPMGRGQGDRPMEALDPIDVMHIQAGYYTRLPAEEQERYPLLVALSRDGTEGVDAAAGRPAFEQALRDRLETEFSEAGAIDIVCADGKPPVPSLTEVSLTRPSDERTYIAQR